MSREITVKCIDCGDTWDTTQRRGEFECCAACDSYFSIEEENIVEKFNVARFIMAYEDGGLNDDEIIEGFQFLIDTGTAWVLQGRYGRMGKQLIERGYCAPKEEA